MAIQHSKMTGQQCGSSMDALHEEEEGTDEKLKEGEFNMYF
jgi:hypothetical protein